MCCNSEKNETEKTCCSTIGQAETKCYPEKEPTNCCATAASACSSTVSPCTDKYAESRMIQECLEYAREAKAAGRPIIGIMCEYAPRELINAIGGVAVCLCGGSQATAEAAEVELSPGICPIIKSTYGYFLQKSNPFLEIADLLVAETTCDGKKKVFELMGNTQECYTLELPQNSSTTEAKEFWKNECIKFRDFLQKRFNTRITDEALESAIKNMNYERSLRMKLAELMTRSAPPISGRELLGYNSIISPLPWAIERYEIALNKYRVATECSGIKDRKRVLITGVPLVHGAERVIDLIEDSGGLVIAQENCTGIKPLTQLVDENSTNPIKAIAEKYISLQCSVMTPNTGRKELLTKLIKEYSPDCIIDLSWQGCHTYDIESNIVKSIAISFSIPILKIQTDYSTSDSQALITRIQALFEIC